MVSSVMHQAQAEQQGNTKVRALSSLMNLLKDTIDQLQRQTKMELKHLAKNRKSMYCFHTPICVAFFVRVLLSRLLDAPSRVGMYQN